MTSNGKTSRNCICHTYTSWGGRHNAITKSVSQLCKKESGCSGKHTNRQRWQQFVERRFNEGLLFKFPCLPYDYALTRIFKGLFDTFRTILFPKFLFFLKKLITEWSLPQISAYLVFWVSGRIEESTSPVLYQRKLPASSPRSMLEAPPGALCQFDVWEKSWLERQLWTLINCFLTWVTQ